MRRFSDIVGQEQLREHLENAVRMNKVSHAYIINGERNAGKEFIARTFAMALQCEDRQDVEPCQECHSCKSASRLTAMWQSSLTAGRKKSISSARAKR